jgi:transcription elongation factor Elf1
MFICPTCESERVTVTAEQSFMVNTGEYFCQSVKTHDSDAKATCLDCWWTGQRQQLMEVKE